MNKNIKPENHKNILWHLKGIFTYNVGTVLFGVLLIYFLVSIILFVTAPSIKSYQVVSGPLVQNDTYTGVVLKQEQLISAATDGYVSYYAREGSKINATGILYGLSDFQNSTSSEELSSEELSQIRNQMSGFSYSFSSDNFSSAYVFKSELQGNILKYATLDTSQITNSGDGIITASGQALEVAQDDGIVLYAKDNYTGITIDSVSQDVVNPTTYQQENLKTQDKVSLGDSVCTLITSENWNLVIPLSAAQAANLTDIDTIRVKFLKDGKTQVGTFSILEKDGKKYGNIGFDKGLIRYYSERYLTIELVTNTATGLKIPVSSLDTREFYKIPIEYASKSGGQDTIGFLKLLNPTDQNQGSEFVQATIYAKSDTDYYVDTDTFNEGDTIIMPESSNVFVIRDKEAKEGVYSINKGYAVFRVVSIIKQNEEYCIIEKDSSYGVAQYDYIALNASAVEENDILK
ncbi:MAG: HlyD family efflux transporter periplasmic adaptor subunit [Lachnospiraceae bacterium]